MTDLITNELRRINQMYTKLDELNAKCEDNMRRLNSMMLELKGIVAMVRPQVKKTGWYGDEILHREDTIKDNVVIEVKYPELEKMN